MMKPMIFCAALALIAGVGAPQLSAEPVCTNADLLGIVRVGEVIADGRGNITVANTASYNGTIIPETYSGTYTVSADCSVDVQPIVGLPLGPGGRW